MMEIIYFKNDFTEYEMKRFIFLLVFSLMIFPPKEFSQVIISDSPFISGAVGAMSFTTGDNRNSQSTLSFAFSSSFGVPVIDNLFIYGRVTYSSVENFSGYFNEIQLNENISAVNMLQLANASFSQLIFNAGLLYRLKVTDEFHTGLSGGVTYSILNHEAYLQNEKIISELNNEGVYGYFGGVMLERKITSENLSLFAEAQYNYIKSDAVYFRRAFSGMNYTFGIRYFFSNR